MLDKLEQLLIGRELDWNELEYDTGDSNTFTVHRFSGTIIHVHDYGVAVQLNDNSKRFIELYELTRYLEHEPDFLQVYWAVSRHQGALRKEAKLADRTPHDIYALIDPRDNLIRYIGMSKQVDLRYSQHINCSGDNERKNAWIRNLHLHNLQPQLAIIEHVDGKYYALRREEYWIDYCLQQGFPLTNVDTDKIDEWSMSQVEEG